MYQSGYFYFCAEVFVSSIQIPDICLCKSVECVFVKFMQGLIKHEQVQLIIQTQHQSSRALCDHWLLTAGGKHRAGARIHRHGDTATLCRDSWTQGYLRVLQTDSEHTSVPCVTLSIQLERCVSTVSRTSIASCKFKLETYHSNLHGND